MTTRYVITLKSNPVSYYDGTDDCTEQLERAKIYSKHTDLIRDFKMLSKKYPERKFFIGYI